MKSKTKLTGLVIFKGDPGYEVARKNWDPHTDRFPKVFVFAKRTQDVANAINWANENNVPIRPRGGRHSLEVNLSQVDGGLVIDVSKMKRIALDKKRSTAIVGSGNTVGRIAKTLAPLGYIAPFGDSPTVGIGGITLGGGIGPLQRTVGLVSDNLIALEMVDAKGRIIRADKKRNADLLWASKGGGGGNLRIHQIQIQGACRSRESDGIPHHVAMGPVPRIAQSLAALGAMRGHETRQRIFDRTEKGGNVTMNGLFLGSKTEAIRLLQPMLSVGTPTSKIIRLLPYPKVVDFLLPPDPVLTQRESNQLSGFGRHPFPDKAIRYMRKFLEQVEGEFAGFSSSNWGGAVSRVAPRATAFYWRKAKYYVEWNSSWVKKSDAAKTSRSLADCARSCSLTSWGLILTSRIKASNIPGRYITARTIRGS